MHLAFDSDRRQLLNQPILTDSADEFYR